MMSRIFFILTLLISPFVNADSVPVTGDAGESQPSMSSGEVESKPAESLIATPPSVKTKPAMSEDPLNPPSATSTETKPAEPVLPTPEPTAAPLPSPVPAPELQAFPEADAPKVQKKVRVRKKPVEQAPVSTEPASPSEPVATPPAPSVEPTPVAPEPVVSPIEASEPKSEKKVRKSKSKKSAQVALLVREDVVVGSAARYVQGEGPLAKRTKITLFVTNNGVELVPENTKVEAWKIPIAKVRGANGAKEGLWFYWFDDQDVTHSAYLETVEDQSGLTAAINKLVTDFHNRPYLESEKLKEDFEKYQQEALKEAQ